MLLRLTYMNSKINDSGDTKNLFSAKSAIAHGFNLRSSRALTNLNKWKGLKILQSG